MKKIFTILLASVSIASFGQRQCDLAVTMAKPTAGQYIKTGTPFEVNYEVKNLGPDALMAGDTVLYGLLINNSPVSGTFFAAVLNADIAKDAVVQTYKLNWTFNFTNETPNAQFCATFQAFKRVGGVKQVNDAVTTNNTGCATVNMTAAIRALGKVTAVATDINASPNPANDFVNVSYILMNPETVTVSLYDMNGRLVLEPLTDKQGSGANSMQLNTSELQSGLYFYEVKIGNESKRYKLMVD